MSNFHMHLNFSIFLISGILIFSILGINTSFAQYDLNSFSEKITESNEILSKISQGIEKINEEKPKTGTPKIISQAKKITLSQPIGYLTKSDSSISTQFLIKNIGTAPTSSINLTPTALNLKGSFLHSDIPNFIDSTQISLSIESQEIPVNGDSKVTMTIDSIPRSELSYEGYIVISGSGFEPVTLDVELAQNIESMEFLKYILAGLLTSISLGLLLILSEKKNQIESIVEQTNSIRDHVNEHITALRKFLYILSYQNSNTDNVRNSIIKIFDKKRDEMIQLYGSGKLKVDSEPVVWLHDILKFLQEKYISADARIFGDSMGKLEEQNEIETLPEIFDKKAQNDFKKKFSKFEKEFLLNSKISKMLTFKSGAVASTVQTTVENTLIEELRKKNPKLNDKEAKEEAKKLENILIEEVRKKNPKLNDKEAKEEAKKLVESLEVTFTQEQLKKIRSSVIHDLIDPKKYAYLIAAIVVSIPTSILISDNISGSLEVNFAFAFGTGFAIYRFKDLKELFKKEK